MSEHILKKDILHCLSLLCTVASVDVECFREPQYLSREYEVGISVHSLLFLFLTTFYPSQHSPPLWYWGYQCGHSPVSSLLLQVIGGDDLPGLMAQKSLRVSLLSPGMPSSLPSSLYPLPSSLYPPCTLSASFLISSSLCSCPWSGYLVAISPLCNMVIHDLLSSSWHWTFNRNGRSLLAHLHATICTRCDIFKKTFSSVKSTHLHPPSLIPHPLSPIPYPPSLIPPSLIPHPLSPIPYPPSLILHPLSSI